MFLSYFAPVPNVSIEFDFVTFLAPSAKLRTMAVSIKRLQIHYLKNGYCYLDFAGLKIEWKVVKIKFTFELLNMKTKPSKVCFTCI